MKTYICVFEPTISARADGALPLSIALTAANEKLAVASAMIRLSESYPDDIYKFNTDEPIICLDQVGSPRPAVGQFDEQFALENEFNGKSWQPAKPVEFKKIAVIVRIVAILLFAKTSFFKSDINKAIYFVHQSKAQPKIRNIAAGLAKITQVAVMDAEQTNEIAQAVFDYADENVNIEQAQKLAESWLADTPSTAAPINEPVVARNYATLDTEIALALLDDFNHENILSSHVRQAKTLINKKNEVWQRWSMELRTYPGILAVPREQVFALITESKQYPQLVNDANGRKSFIEEKLSGSNNQQTAIEQPANEKSKRGRKTKEIKVKEKNSSVIETLQPEMDKPAIQTTEDFQQRAAVIEDTIKQQDASSQNNLRIWKQVQRTDPRFTKPLDGVGFTGTSINSTYMFMRATEIFGALGKGWGYQVLEEKLVNGIPLLEPIVDNHYKQIGSRFLRDADGSLIYEQNHSIKILFWYVIDGERAEIESYGATPYRYKTKHGIKTDGEAIKKSLTDAIKKALSMMGFSADVFMGMHDNPEYLFDNKIEFDIKAASDKAEDLARLRKELDEKFTRNTATMRTAVTKNELRGIASTITREMSVHLKHAKDRNDEEYEKYLSDRLRRLNQIEHECLVKLEGATQ